MLRSNPHLIEINARLWLKTLRKKYSLGEMTLSSIPEEEWMELKHLGFDIVWLMGVWTPSPASAETARADDRLDAALKDISPSLNKDALGSSPYAVYDDSGLFKHFALRAILDGLTEPKMSARQRPCIRPVRSRTFPQQHASITNNDDTHPTLTSA